MSTYNEKALIKDTIEVVVQINGKVKAKLDVQTGLSKDEFEKVGLADESVQKLIDGKEVVKVIAVPGKLLNIVIKG